MVVSVPSLAEKSRASRDDLPDEGYLNDGSETRTLVDGWLAGREEGNRHENPSSTVYLMMKVSVNESRVSGSS